MSNTGMTRLRCRNSESFRLRDAKFPNPALAVVDLRPVVCRALCAVTCVACWACDVNQGIEPPRLPLARQEGAGLPAGSRVCARLHVGYLLPVGQSSRSTSQLTR